MDIDVNKDVDDGWEYIVVGSGAGGGPVAANLARAGHKVLLLEAGGAPESYNYQVPAFHPTCSEEDDVSWKFFVRHYEDEEQQKLDTKYCPQERGIFYPRASTLGGCTAHNALIFAYPHNSDWERIAELTGDRSWRPWAMRRYYERLEDCGYRGLLRSLHRLCRWNPSRHGFGGWLRSEKADFGLLLGDRILRWLVMWSALKSLLSSGGNAVAHLVRFLFFLVTSGDPNSWWSVATRSEGFRITPLTRSSGRRTGTRERLLAVQKECPDLLTIKLGALATRVLFDDQQRAVGVEYLEGEHLYRADPGYRPESSGRRCQARASREVILAGGAFNTPQLLQLSGIGPADLLRRHCIPVRVDLPGVGTNLQDRYEISVVLKMKKDFSTFAGASLVAPKPGEKPDAAFTQWLGGGGPYTTNGAAMSIIKRSSPKLRDPDLFLFGLVTDFRGYYPGYSKATQAARRYFSWTVLKGSTHNTAGRVAIRSADPRDVPEIDFHYFDPGTDPAGKDLEAVAGAVEFIRSITAGYGRRVEAEVVPGPGTSSPEQIRRFVRNEAWGHHASCTCKIGRPDDPSAVLDSEFRVRGTQGLRVVDASVFPHIPGLFIVLAVYMIAEKASDVILADARKSGARKTGVRHSIPSPQGGAMP
ncbi:MAG TPA: GMC family oxidoreductase [Thermoanaerobaculia bacterium]